MKIRYLVAGLSAIVALAVAIPAFASTHSNHAAHRDAASAHPKRAAGHARKAAADVSSLSYTAAYPTAAQRAQLAKTGSVTLPISIGSTGFGLRLNSTGTIAVSGEAAVGTETETAIGTAPDGTIDSSQVPKNWEATVEPTSVTATHAGTVDLTLNLTAAAKAELAAGRHLQMYLDIGSPPSEPSLGMMVPLGGN